MKNESYHGSQSSMELVLYLSQDHEVVVAVTEIQMILYKGYVGINGRGVKDSDSLLSPSLIYIL